MGVNAEFHIRLPKSTTLAEKSKAQSLLIHPLRVLAGDDQLLVEVTTELDLIRVGGLARYYSANYRKGHWPMLAIVGRYLLWRFKAAPKGTVYYTSDTYMGPPLPDQQLTHEKIMEMDEDYFNLTLP